MSGDVTDAVRVAAAWRRHRRHNAATVMACAVVRRAGGNAAKSGMEAMRAAAPVVAGWAHRDHHVDDEAALLVRHLAEQDATVDSIEQHRTRLFILAPLPYSIQVAAREMGEHGPADLATQQQRCGRQPSQAWPSCHDRANQHPQACVANFSTLAAAAAARPSQRLSFAPGRPSPSPCRPTFG